MTHELDAKLQELGRQYFNEFKETSVDAEWSQTAYEDLGSLKNEMDWSEFHFALGYQAIQESQLQADWAQAWNDGRIDDLIQMGAAEREKRK